MQENEYDYRAPYTNLLLVMIIILSPPYLKALNRLILHDRGISV